MKLAEFIRVHSLRMSSDWTDENPNMDPWPEASHYKCIIRHGRKQLTTYFSMGPAHTSEPELRDVLSCLADDASGYENARDFDDWSSEYGYDSDSRKAEHTYRTIERQSKRLRAFLGDAEYQSLLWDTERE